MCESLDLSECDYDLSSLGSAAGFSVGSFHSGSTDSLMSDVSSADAEVSSASMESVSIWLAAGPYVSWERELPSHPVLHSTAVEGVDHSIGSGRMYDDASTYPSGEDLPPDLVLHSTRIDGRASPISTEIEMHCSSVCTYLESMPAEAGALEIEDHVVVDWPDMDEVGENSCKMVATKWVFSLLAIGALVAVVSLATLY